RPVYRRADLSQSLWPFVGGHTPANRRVVGQLSADLFDGRPNPDSNAAIAKLGGSLLARLILVSNRVPDPSAGHRAGGLEVVLGPAFKQRGGVWFGWSGRAVPRDAVSTQRVDRAGVTYMLADLSEEDFEEYYNGFANRVLWPILHYRLDLAEFSRRD